MTAAPSMGSPREIRWKYFAHETVAFLDAPDQRFSITTHCDGVWFRVFVQHSVIREDTWRETGKDLGELQEVARGYIERRAIAVAEARSPLWICDFGQFQSQPIADVPDWYLAYVRRMFTVNEYRRQAAEAEIARRAHAKQESLAI